MLASTDASSAPCSQLEKPIMIVFTMMMNAVACQGTMYTLTAANTTITMLNRPAP